VSLGSRSDGFAKFLDRQIVAVRLKIGQTQVVVGVGVVGIEPDGLEKFGYASFQVILTGIGAAQTVVVVGFFGLIWMARL